MVSLEQAGPPGKRQLLASARGAIQDVLPQGWELVPTADGDGSTQALAVTAPEGRSAPLLLVACALLDAREVPLLTARYAEWIQPGKALVVVARYLSQRARQVLADAGVSFLDATGWVRLEINSNPGLLVMLQGKDRDPWRTPDRPTASLSGIPAARVVRALVDGKPPWKIRGLAQEAGTSLGSTSRTVALLDREALLTRGGAGEITSVDWPDLLERWATDYELRRRRRVVGLLQPRPLATLEDPLRAYGQQYAITGSMAAAQWAPHAEGRLAMIYSSDVEALQGTLGLREVFERPNVLLIEPEDDYVFARSQERDGLRYAAPSQVVVDLLKGGGRSPDEGRELLRWMQAHEADWRST